MLKNKKIEEEKLEFFEFFDVKIKDVE
jgi:hypothetical protein